MGEETRGKAAPGFRWVIWILFLLFVVYPLSMAPVWSAISQLGYGMELRPQLECFYFPILYLCDVSPPADAFFRWYYELWGT